MVGFLGRWLKSRRSFIVIWGWSLPRYRFRECRFNVYNHSVHNETKGSHAPVRITTIQINSEKNEEILSNLKKALSKVDEIEDEDQRELASEYLEQTFEEVESGNIKPVKLEKRKKFFEKHKIDWVGLTGLALGAIQVIQGLL